MRFHQITQERSEHHPDIHQSLVQRGYKLLGKGLDQQAYLEPGTGHVLKIFGTDESSLQTPGAKPVLTPSQRMFVAFAKYCEAHQDNPHLPRIYGWETFYWESPSDLPSDSPKAKKHIYLQIRTERLWPVRDDLAKNLYDGMGQMHDLEPGQTFELFVDWFIETLIDMNEDPQAVEQYRKMFADRSTRQQLKNLYTTMGRLNSIGRRLRYNLDLHVTNVMQRRDGTPVVTDPWMLHDEF